MVPNFEEPAMSCRDGLKANDYNVVLSMLVDKWVMGHGTREGGPSAFTRDVNVSVSHGCSSS